MAPGAAPEGAAFPSAVPPMVSRIPGAWVPGFSAVVGAEPSPLCWHPAMARTAVRAASGSNIRVFSVNLTLNPFHAAADRVD